MVYCAHAELPAFLLLWQVVVTDETPTLLEAT
jgi:hypothetical protein